MARQVLRDLLVVSGEQLTEEVLASQLRADGYQVRGARCCAEAMDLVRQRRPEAVLTDLRLAGESGLGVVRQIRARADLSDLPILMMVPSASATGRGAVLEGLRLGATDAICKPIDLPLLREKLRLLLRMRELTEQRRRSIALLSDDLEAPLHTIRGLTTMLRNGAIGPQADPVRAGRVVAAIDRACDDLRRQLALFLHCLRTENSAVELEFQASNINEIARGACQELGVPFSPVRDCPPAICDALAVTAALRSLLQELATLAAVPCDRLELRVGYEEHRQRFVLTVLVPIGALAPGAFQEFLHRLRNPPPVDRDGSGAELRGLSFPRVVVDGHGGSLELGPATDGQRELLISIPLVPPLVGLRPTTEGPAGPNE